MASTQYGTSLQMGATLTLTIPNANSYIVRRATEGKYNVSLVDTDDANGVLANRAVKSRRQIISAELICKTTTAAPLTDFPEGTAVAVSNNTTWWVNSAPVEHTADPWVVTVELENIGLTLVV